LFQKKKAKAMFRLKVTSKLASALSILAVSAGLLAATAPAAHAGANKVLGVHTAWINDFGGGSYGYSFGSNSNWPDMSISYNFGSTKLWGYPAIIRGIHYTWKPVGSDNLFPKRVSAIGSSNCSFSYSSGGSNMSGDFAYDIFLRNTTSWGNPQLEIMVWGNHNSYPVGTRTSTYALNQAGRNFELWEGNNSAAGYYVFSFIQQNSAGQGNLNSVNGSLNVNLKSFYNWLASNRGSRFNNNLYVHVVEAGLETLRGNGWAYMGAYINS